MSRFEYFPKATVYSMHADWLTNDEIDQVQRAGCECDIASNGLKPEVGVEWTAATCRHTAFDLKRRVRSYSSHRF